jgi:hypothetical protein
MTVSVWGLAADVRLQAGYMTVLLLAFYQLCTSAVAAAEGRGRGERLAFMAGTLALVAPLLALPLRSGGLLWRGDLNHRYALGQRFNNNSAPYRNLRAFIAGIPAAGLPDRCVSGPRMQHALVSRPRQRGADSREGIPICREEVAGTASPPIGGQTPHHEQLQNVKGAAARRYETCNSAGAATSQCSTKDRRSAQTLQQQRYVPCRNVFNLHVHAGGQPATAGHTIAAKRPLDSMLYGCSEADPLLWVPAPLPPPLQFSSTRQPDQQQLAARRSAVQHVPQGCLVALQGGYPGSGMQISAHRPAASTPPITIGGRRHDWWTLQLQDQRTGFVPQVTESLKRRHHLSSKGN